MATAADSAIEAESMTVSPVSARETVSDSAASAGAAVILRSDSTASTRVTLPGAATVSVVAKGQQCSGAPSMTVSIDGKKVLKTTVPTTEWTTYRVANSVTAGDHTIAVAFTNSVVKSNCSRALLVDKLIVTTSAPTTSTTPTTPTTTSTSPTTTTPTTPTSTTPTTPPSVNPATGHGYTGGAGGSGLLGLSDQDLARELGVARDAGMRYVRVDVDWSQIEPRRGTRSWTTADRVINAIVAAGMTPLGLVTYAPPWAATSTALHAPPADPATFAAFAKDAATRYRDRVRAWEVWNEPNISQFWAPQPNSTKYAALLAATYPAIKAVDPTLFVLSAGLSPATDSGGNIAPVTFVRNLYSTGANRYLDAVGMHPYTFPALPDDPAAANWSSFQQLSPIHDVMVAGGDTAKTIWLTEFGAPTGTSSAAVSESVQAQTIDIVLQAARNTSWLGPAFIYSIRDAGTNAADREHNFGIVRRDFTQKQAFAVAARYGAQS